MIWPLPESVPELLQLAYGYPYAAPSGGFLLRDGQVASLDKASFHARVPVLAHGSNRAPAQLARKFPIGDIPVTRGWLDDHLVVFAACLTRYGACPSLLYHRPGSRSRLSINWLTREQLAFMHLTEGNYRFGTLAAGFQSDEGPRPETVYLYHGNHGPLLLNGQPVGLAAVEASGALPQLRRQEQVLAELQKLAGGGGSLDDFVLQMIRDAGARRRFIRRLTEHSRLDALPAFKASEEAPAPTL